MYWPGQEKYIFFLTSFLAGIFHVCSVLILREDFSFALLLGDLIVFAGMIKYAKWVFKDISYPKSVMIVVLSELVSVTLFGGVFYLPFIKKVS